MCYLTDTKEHYTSGILPDNITESWFIPFWEEGCPSNTQSDVIHVSQWFVWVYSVAPFENKMAARIQKERKDVGEEVEVKLDK